MIYYFLLADIMALILVYIVCILWKNKSALSTPVSQLLYIPIIISLLIITWYSLNGSNGQIEVRKNEYVAIGMKRYNDCIPVNTNGKNRFSILKTFDFIGLNRGVNTISLSNNCVIEFICEFPMII
jgi:hypothetical protein